MTKQSTPLGIANFDSASVMLRALARFLHGQDFPALGQPRPCSTSSASPICCRGTCASASSPWAVRSRG